MTAAAHQGDAEGTVAVRVEDNAFDPGTVEVVPGTTVVWTNEGNDSHTVTAADGAFDSARLDPGESFSVRFDQPGAFAYGCDFHPGMNGTVVVSEGAAASAAGTPDPEGAGVPELEAGGDPGGADGPAGPTRDLAPVETPRLAHIHAGTCEELGIVVYSLAGLRGYRNDSAAGSNTPVTEMVVGRASVALEDLFGEPFSIHVHKSVGEKQIYLGCADVGGRPEDPWTPADGLSLRVAEQQDSGFTGFVSLRPALAGGTDIAIVLAGDVATLEAAEAAPAPPRGTTYSSPTFGYTLTYGPQWRVTEDASANGRDRFVLANGTSFVTLTGAEGYGGDPQACVDDFVATLTADPNVRDLGLAVDENGEPLQGGTAATGAFAVFNHGYDFGDRLEEYTLFVGCVPLEADASVLAFVQNVPTADYNGQVEPREALLRSLVLPS